MADQVELEDGVQPDTTPVCSHGTAAGDCKKCADAARKRKQREKQRQEKKKEAKLQLPLTEWQEANRKELSKDQNAELAQRHEEVLDQIHWLRAGINGTYNVDPNDTNFYVGLEEGIEDMERDVKQYGVLLGYDVLSNLVRAYRKDSEYRANLKNTKMWGEPIFNDENADEIWIKYGYLAAIPSQMTCDIRMKAHPVQPAPRYVKMRCTNKECPQKLTNTLTQVEADRYVELGIPFLCPLCRRLDNISRGKATISLEQRRPAGKGDIYDAWGRIKHNQH